MSQEALAQVNQDRDLRSVDAHGSGVFEQERPEKEKKQRSC
jgi:hypothetical protein